MNKSPCQEFKCDFYDKCSSEEVACWAFAFFVENDKASYELFELYPLPTKKIFNLIFQEEQHDFN
jgi:hypothetical protein